MYIYVYIKHRFFPLLNIFPGDKKWNKNKELIFLVNMRNFSLVVKYIERNKMERLIDKKGQKDKEGKLDAWR